MAFLGCSRSWYQNQTRPQVSVTESSAPIQDCLNHPIISCLSKLNNPVYPLLLKLSTRKKKSIKLGNCLHLALCSVRAFGFESKWHPASDEWRHPDRLPSLHPLPFMVSRDGLLSFVTQLQSSCWWGSHVPTLPAQPSYPSPPDLDPAVRGGSPLCSGSPGQLGGQAAEPCTRSGSWSTRSAQGRHSPEGRWESLPILRLGDSPLYSSKVNFPIGKHFPWTFGAILWTTECW